MDRRDPHPFEELKIEVVKEVAKIEKTHHQEILERLDAISAKVDPMYEMFTSVSGFNRISMWILKLLATIGAGILALYVVIEFFRKLSK